jgi:DNA repair exonuclease SbcCD ATPase subunit
MSIWNRMRKSTQVVSEKSAELLEMAKIWAAISKIETEMVKKYTELGKLTYRIYNEEKVDDQAIEKTCAEIRELDRELQGYRDQLAGVVTSCPVCKRPVKPGMRYCPDCGQAL